jgi:hypothetical protein
MFVAKLLGLKIMNSFNKYLLSLGFASLSLVSVFANAAPVLTFGANSSVAVIDRSATFNSITGSGTTDLSRYTEDGLKVQTPTSHLNCCFAGGWYPSGGYDSHISQSASLDRISTVDGITMQAIELTFKDWGEHTNFPTFVWQTYKGTVMTGTGTFATPIGNKIIGWSDVQGIDQLRVGVFGSGTNNPLWLDDVHVQLQKVPEPGSFALLALGIVGIGFIRRKKA